jgi:uncharacterized protein involved in propanediol utilization
VLFGAVRRAVRSQDAALLARASTESARINQRYLPNPLFDLAVDVGRSAGALGLVVAHTGTALGLVFSVDAGWRVERACAELAANDVEEVFVYRTDREA